MFGGRAHLAWADEVAIELAIEVAVSADMSESLANKVQAIHDSEWQTYKSHDPRASQAKSSPC